MADRVPYSLDDPTVSRLARFLERVPVSSGMVFQGLSSPTSDLLAQAVCNWTRGLVFQDGDWVEASVWDTTPDLGDVEIESLADGQVIKMTQRSTGISALGETHDQAWAELRRKAVSSNG